MWLDNEVSGFKSQLTRPLASLSLSSHTCEWLSNEETCLERSLWRLNKMIHEMHSAHSHNCYFSGLWQVEEGNSRCHLRAVGWDCDCPSIPWFVSLLTIRMCPEGAELRLAWLGLVCSPDSGVYFHRSFSVKAELSHCLWTGWLRCTNSPGASLSKSRKRRNGTCAYCIPTVCLMVYML